MAGQIMQQHPGGGPQQPPPPRPPRKIPYHDGISKSVPYNDIYEMIRRPNTHPTRTPPEPPAHYNDPYYYPPTKQQKLEKKLQQRFENNDYALPGNRYLAVGKVLKFIVLFFALPPYLVFYTLPRLLLVKVIPFFWGKVENYLSGIASKGKNYTFKIKENILTKIKSVKNSLSKNVIQPYQALIQSCQTYIANIIKKGKKHLEQIKAFKKQLVDYPSRIKAQITSKLKNLSTSIAKQYLRLKQIKTKFIESKQKISQWFQEKIQQIQAPFRKLNKRLLQIKDALLHPKKVLESRYQALKEFFRVKQEAFNAKIKRWKSFFSIKPKLVAKWNEFKLKFITPIQNKLHRLEQRIENFRKKIVNKLNVHLQPLIAKKKIVQEKLNSTFQKINLIPKPVIAFNPTPYLSPIKKKITLFKQRMQSLEIEVKQKLSKFPAKTTQWVPPVKSRWSRYARVAKARSAHIVFKMRWWAAWTTVLTKYSLYQAKIKADEIGAWLALSGLGIA